MTDIIDFLKKHNYTITVNYIDNSINLKLPAIKNRFENKEGKSIKYELKYGKKSHILKTDREIERISVPEYAIRVYICAAIIKECLNISYDFKLIEVFNKKGESIGYGLTNDFFDLMKEPKNFEKEDNLFKLFHAAMTTGFLEAYEESAQESGILDGYLQLRNLIIGDLI